MPKESPERRRRKRTRALSFATWAERPVSEREVQVVRLGVVIVTVATWTLLPKPPGWRVEYIWWLLVLACAYIVLETLRLNRQSWRLDRAMAYLTSLADLGFITLGVYLTGGDRSPYRLLFFPGLATLCLRLPGEHALVGIAAYAAALAGTAQAHPPTDVAYLVATGAVAVLWQRRSARVHREDMFDGLTGAVTRRHGQRYLEHLLAHRALPLAICMVDVDQLKACNDQHGHLAGDQALQAVVDTIRRNTRGTDMVMRFGGDEFLIACPDTTLVDVGVVAERLARAVSECPIALPGDGNHTVRVGVSIGCAGAHDKDGFASLVRRADAALYADKAKKRSPGT